MVHPQKQHTLTDRDTIFEQGRVFEHFVLKEPSRFSGRFKYFLRTTSESALSTHWCIGCVWAKGINENDILLFHYKMNAQKKTKLTYDNSMDVFTPLLNQTMKRLFD